MHKEKKMTKVEKTYKENGIKITRYEAPRPRKGQIIKAKNPRRVAKSSAPRTRISSLYKQEGR